MPASWYSLTHGTSGLVLAYGLTFFALVVTLAQQRAPAKAIFLSPLLALPCAAAGLLAAAAAASLMPVLATPGGRWVSPIISTAILIFAGFAGGMVFTRRTGETDTHKPGTVIEPLRRCARIQFDAVTLAGVEIPELDETKHFKLLGTTGSGKSTAIRELLTGVLERGDRAIIADPDGSYLKHFYTHTRGDVILNPFEERSYRWDLLGEIEKPYDVEQLAHSLISEGADDASREWREQLPDLTGFLKIASWLEWRRVQIAPG